MEVIARLTADEMLGDRIIKVNHAAEHGAVNIYRAQLLVSWRRKSDLKSQLREFLEHEKRRRAIFAVELNRRRRHRYRSYWRCGIGGFVLGLVTGCCGVRSIPATTVESVVLRHLQAQVAALSSVDLAAVSAIKSIYDDELAHRDGAAFGSRADMFWVRLLQPLMSWATEAVIWLGMRL